MSSDVWPALRKFTRARIGLGRVGSAQKTSTHLEFQKAHAAARDSIHLNWDIQQFKQALATGKIPSRILESQAPDRLSYLKRPDLGRKLSKESVTLLKKVSKKCDVALVVSNGLSSLSVEKHGIKLASCLVKSLKELGLKVAPVSLIANSRVAIADEVGFFSQARLSVIIIGERPGLSSADSLAIYMTYQPKPGNTDALRNCISNIHPPDGLSIPAAVFKASFLVSHALKRQLSGVDLKDESDLVLFENQMETKKRKLPPKK